jgi:hypothetical protein
MRMRGAGDGHPRADGMPETPRAEGRIQTESWGHAEQRIESAGRLKRR